MKYLKYVIAGAAVYFAWKWWQGRQKDTGEGGSPTAMIGSKPVGI